MKILKALLVVIIILMVVGLVYSMLLSWGVFQHEIPPTKGYPSISLSAASASVFVA